MALVRVTTRSLVRLPLQTAAGNATSCDSDDYNYRYHGSCAYNPSGLHRGVFRRASDGRRFCDRQLWRGYDRCCGDDDRWCLCGRRSPSRVRLLLRTIVETATCEPFRPSRFIDTTAPVLHICPSEDYTAECNRRRRIRWTTLSATDNCTRAGHDLC